MQYAIGEAIGSVLGITLVGGLFTLIAVVFGKAIGKPLNKMQKISTFAVICALWIAAIMFNHFSG